MGFRVIGTSSEMLAVWSDCSIICSHALEDFGRKGSHGGQKGKLSISDSFGK